MQRKKLKTDTVTTTTTEITTPAPFNSVTALGLIQDLITKVWNIIRIVVFLVFIISILTIGLQLQVSSRNHSLDELKKQQDRFEVILKDVNTTTNDARDSAIAARKAVEDAIASSSTPNPELSATLDRIHRIEFALCGGPCPDLPK